MQDMLKLTRQQQKLARGIWQEWHEGLARAKQDRQRILSEMQASGAAASMQRGMRPDMFSETSVFLEQAAALAENCVIQQEITLNCHHRFLLQVNELNLRSAILSVGPDNRISDAWSLVSCQVGGGPVDADVTCLAPKFLAPRASILKSAVADHCKQSQK